MGDCIGRTERAEDGRRWEDGRQFSGEEEKNMYKTSGHGRAFMARAWCFLGGVEETCQDTTECVSDGLGIPNSMNSTSEGYDPGGEIELGRRHHLVGSGPGQVWRDSGEQREAPPFPRNSKKSAIHIAMASIERSEEPAAGAPGRPPEASPKEARPELTVEK